MRILYTADLHLTDRPNDEYRWDVFPWLEKRMVRYNVQYLIILGDMTDRKDDHSAALVNRLVDNLSMLAKRCKMMFLLKGNHDYVDANVPFFRFLHNSLRGKLLFYHMPVEIGMFQERWLFLPHTRGFRSEYGKYDLAKYDKVFLHQPIRGAMTESGGKMDDGIRRKSLARAKRVFAGDIHVPQTLGNITYIGAPYPVRYGDTYTPRVILEEDGKFRDLIRKTIRKDSIKIGSIEEFDRCAYIPGDMVKVEVALPRTDIKQWHPIQRHIEKFCRKNNVTLGGLRLTEVDEQRRQHRVRVTQRTVSPTETLRNYGRVRRMTPQRIAAGLDILAESIGKGGDHHG